VITPVILSGGSGTRLWPLSTRARPKQFLPLVGKESLFHETLQRVADRDRYAAPVIVANAAHEALCLAELADTAGARLILEPVARNTAVAIVMAAIVALRSDPNAVLLVMPSDHRIIDEAAFHQAVQRGAGAAGRRLLVTFGIEPTHAETGYGYLEAGEQLGGLDEVYAVARFKEKPDLAAAEQMIAAGRHYWNGGIFLFRADVFLGECRKSAPEIFRSGEDAVAAGESEGGIFRPALQPLLGCPDISVDYAVMERSDVVSMVPLAAQWSDVGSWDALADLAAAHMPDDGKVQALDSSNCYVRTNGPKIALLGAEDLIVVATDDQIVIIKRGRSQDIKQLAALAANG
jgi:mannose-1-phosphate guanylyltransferase/mannose-6-phosphate isomerase